MLGFKIVRRQGAAYASTFVRNPLHVLAYEIGKTVAMPHAPAFFLADSVEGAEIAKWIVAPVEIVLLRVEAAGEIRRMESVADDDGQIGAFWADVLAGYAWPSEASWTPALPTYAAPLLTPLALAYVGRRGGRSDDAWAVELEAALERARAGDGEPTIDIFLPIVAG